MDRALLEQLDIALAGRISEISGQREHIPALFDSVAGGDERAALSGRFHDHGAERARPLRMRLRGGKMLRQRRRSGRKLTDDAAVGAKISNRLRLFAGE